MKQQSIALWKQLRSQPAAIVAVVVMLVAALATVMHAYCMRKAVDKTVHEAFFNVSVTNPSAAIIQRKVGPYAFSGLTQFFSSGTSSVIQPIIDQSILFFQPTESDILCDFTTTNSSCEPRIDTITCSDSLTPFPASRKVINMAQLSNTLVEPKTSDDCTVFVHDGLYRFSKVALWVPASAWVPPGQPESGPCYLVLPRRDIVTKLIMLMRPAFIRTKGSMLYSVAYNTEADNRKDADWISYDSWDDKKKTVALMLWPVTDKRIENPDNLVTMPKLLPPPKDSQRKVPSTLSAVDPRSDLPSQPLVLYYLKYTGPNPTGKNLPSGAATIYQSIDASFDVQASGSDGKPVLKATRLAAKSDIDIYVPGVATKMSIPAIDQGVLVVTRTGNAVIASAFAPTRVSVRRWTINSWLVYSVSDDNKKPGSGASSALVPKVGMNSVISVPCVADIALRTTGLLETDVTTVDMESDLNNDFGNTLDGSKPMRPGKFLVSLDKRYTAKYQADCNLVVWDTATNFPVWDSKSRMPSSTAGTLDLDPETGVLTMQTAGGSRYWWSTALKNSRKDLGKYVLVLENDGVLRIRSGYGNIVAWESSPGSYGSMYLATCQDAAFSYQGQHSGESTYRLAANAWDHYQRFGKTAGYAWPGPDGPC